MTVFKVAKQGMSESQFRMFFTQMFTQGSFLNARNGVFGPSGLGVNQTSTASASVTVDAGMAVAQTSNLSGAFPVINDTTLTLNVLGPNPMGGLPRNDIVVIDSATESVRVIVGTPNASPTDPTVPDSAVALARLRHPASATSVAAAVIDDLRMWTTMRGGIVFVRSQADRDAIYPSRSTTVYRADLSDVALEIFNGSSWDRVYTDTMFTATCSFGSGYATASTGPAPTVSRVGRMVTFNAKVLRSSGTGTTVCMIPSGYRPNASAYDPNVVLMATSQNGGNTEGPGFNAVANPSGSVVLSQIDTGKAWTSGTYINLSGSWFI